MLGSGRSAREDGRNVRAIEFRYRGDGNAIFSARAGARSLRAMFIRNLWYMAAWPHEVSAQPLARTLLGDPVVLYRLRDGRVCALEDRCAHRNMPLSLGTVEDDCIVCPYHALAYAADGRCVRIPAQDSIPAQAFVRSYPLVERDGIVWIWLGDPKRADPAQIVPYPYHGADP